MLVNAACVLVLEDKAVAVAVAAAAALAIEGVQVMVAGARALVNVLQELARATVATALPEAAVCHLAGAAIASHLLEVVMNQQMVTEVLLSKRLVGA